VLAVHRGRDVEALPATLNTMLDHAREPGGRGRPPMR
jgi:hypothetical protein